MPGNALCCVPNIIKYFQVLPSIAKYCQQVLPSMTWHCIAVPGIAVAVRAIERVSARGGRGRGSCKKVRSALSTTSSLTPANTSLTRANTSLTRANTSLTRANTPLTFSNQLGTPKSPFVIRWLHNYGLLQNLK